MSTFSAASGVELIGASKAFGAFRALDEVSLKVAPGTVHALLGENGAGKSTLVKGLVGYGPLDSGAILVDGREVRIASPRDAQALGIGMVYQHFTVAAGLTVAENLLLARGRLPWRIDWAAERAALDAFMRRMPFRLAPDASVASLAAGEKQKLEILKQLYLRQRFLILDEPTSVLTPQEADEVLGLMRTLASRGELTVLMITHKFREVMAYADDVTVLRKGRVVGSCAVVETDRERLAAWMMGGEALAPDGAASSDPKGDPAAAATPGFTVGPAFSVASAVGAASASAGPAPGQGCIGGVHGAAGFGPATAGTARAAVAAPALRGTAPRGALAGDAPVRLSLSQLSVVDDRGHEAVREVSLEVRAGEIVGLAGVSGNGQKELIEALVGQRRVRGGEMRVQGARYGATREEMTRLRVYALPEEPLRNACVAGMSVAENLALRDFDRAPLRRGGWRLDRRALRARAEALIAAFNVRPPLPERAVGTLSGGNVQRVVLARELGQAVDVLIVVNPVFGLDFASVADIHARLLAARDAGTAVLLVSEDLDELLELADRIVVMAEGRLVFETAADAAERVLLGRHMAGAHGDGEPAPRSTALQV